MFILLSVVHILGNMQTVRQLRIPQRKAPSTLALIGPDVSVETRTGFLQRMFTPKGYPDSVVETYTQYRCWCILDSMLSKPKQVVTSMLFWSNIYGVGNAASTPSEAVL